MAKAVRAFFFTDIRADGYPCLPKAVGEDKTAPVMGKVRRGGYIFEWWVGDHPPRHIHVSDSNGELLGRVALETGGSLDDWKPPKRVLDIIRQLEQEKRL